ncbi:hypothetical protein KCP69_21565 [Salmonella enterica subsp. enterica]|nr:hypothetical protein KCP69_21565 [Salmonella enterica subsp. enterica]
MRDRWARSRFVADHYARACVSPKNVTARYRSTSMMRTIRRKNHRADA